MKALRRELKLYGTNTAVMNEMTLGKKSLLENKDMKTDLLRTLSGTVFGPKPGFFIILPSSKFKTY